MPMQLKSRLHKKTPTDSGLVSPARFLSWLLVGASAHGVVASSLQALPWCPSERINSPNATAGMAEVAAAQREPRGWTRLGWRWQEACGRAAEARPDTEAPSQASACARVKARL